MKKANAASVRMCCSLAVLILGILTLSDHVSAQGRSPTGSSQGSQATPLPISGRTDQGGSAKASEVPIAGATTSVNTINPTVQVQGAYGGSTLSTTAMPFEGTLTLRDAIDRGLRYNLGAVGLTRAIQHAHGEMRAARSVLLPNLTADGTETVEEINLKALGVRFSVPVTGVVFPTIVGPFNYIDLRAKLSQTVLDLTQVNNFRAANRTVQANKCSAENARDLVILAVGGQYLQVIAAKARVQSARAQVDTANALYQQTLQKRGAGLVAQVDLDRSEVEVLTQQQLRVTNETLDLTCQRFDAGITDNIEVVQAQESVASAQCDYINSLFAHNLAKLSFARGIGRAENKLTTFLKML
jgi:outer membrane protein TolC